MYPKNDELCASIISQIIINNSDSRAASSIVDITRDRNQVYALRQKMFGNYLPYPYPYPPTKTESRSASVISNPISACQGPNKVYELRKLLFGRRYS